MIGHSEVIMERNFTLPDTLNIVISGQEVDLHNLFSVRSAGWDVGGKRFQLHMVRNEIESSYPHQPQQVRISFEGNVKVVFNDLALRSRPLMSETIDVIGYFDQSCSEWGSFLDERLAAERPIEGVAILFEWDFDLRVSCQKAIAEAFEEGFVEVQPTEETVPEGDEEGGFARWAEATNLSRS